MSTVSPRSPRPRKVSRRRSLRVLGSGVVAAGAAALAGGLPARATETDAPQTGDEGWQEFFQKHYQTMSREEVQGTLRRLERKYTGAHGRAVTVSDTPAQEGVVYGYAINLSACKGYRDCVHACVKENNLSRDPEVQYIRVLEMDRGSMKLAESDHYFDHPVPAPDKFYLAVQCQQCDEPPCVDACPVEATWMEPDGIVVVDYDWCIGCRYCATACPYWARHFNWSEPTVPSDELNPDTHYLSNRPRPVGVIEKCTFCLHRVREGRMPACQEACPTGARVFGNLLDPQSDIRYVLEHKTVFRLKEELGTEPKFWYYTD